MRENERKRLYYLFQERKCPMHFLDNKEILDTVDYLLENGVVVLPCKVGDIVYQTDGIRIYELTILDILLHKNKPYYETDEVDFDDDAIGTSIFLIKEEAEAKLKGDEGK